MARLMLIASLASFASLAACGSSDECAEDGVQVMYLGGDRDGEAVCKPKPAVCGATASCGNIDCIREMYSYCEAPYSAVGCSDTFPPPIISCNP